MTELVLTQNMLTSVKQGLIDSLTVASGAKSSATYYHGKDEQLQAIRNNVKGLYSISKELPLIVANQKGVTGKFISEVLLNEFKNTLHGGACNIVNPIDWYDNGLSDKAILSALRNLDENNGITYVLRLFVDLKTEKINNERARKIALGYIWGQDNIEFYVMKYRNKIADILRHVYGSRMTSILISIASKHKRRVTNIVGTEKEMGIMNENILKFFNGDPIKAMKILLFIFKEDHEVRYTSTVFPLLSEYQKAKTDITDVKNVPEEVLLGLISDTNHPQYESKWSSAILREATKALIRKNVQVTSVNQQVRQTKSTAKLGVQKDVKVEKATDFMALYKTGYETSFTPEIKDAIDKLVLKNKIQGFSYDNIGIIVDTSNSMKGHKQASKNTPRAIVDYTARVLMASAKNTKIVETDGEVTDIATSFIKLLKAETAIKQYNAIFILTDGYENAYDGLTNEVIEVWRAETGRVIPVFQISPITGAETGGNVRKLGKDVVTMAINNPIALQPQISARLLEIDTKMWLENQVTVLEAAPVKRIKKIIVNV